MGQAKRRGTLEERKALAKTANEIRFQNQRRLREERQRIKAQEEAIREAAMTPEEKAQRLKNRLATIQILGMAMGMGTGIRF